MSDERAELVVPRPSIHFRDANGVLNDLGGWVKKFDACFSYGEALPARRGADGWRVSVALKPGHGLEVSHAVQLCQSETPWALSFDTVECSCVLSGMESWYDHVSRIEFVPYRR